MFARRARPAPTAVRPFDTTDLLVNLADLPEGWRVSEDSPSRILDYLTGRDPATASPASRIVFVVEPYRAWYEAAHSVYRFPTRAAAQHVYERHGLGETPPEWTDPGAHADATRFLCRALQGEPALTYCAWSATYQEYYVEFDAALVPGKMSLVDVARIVQAIDEKMLCHVVGAGDPPCKGGN